MHIQNISSSELSEWLLRKRTKSMFVSTFYLYKIEQTNTE